MKRIDDESNSAVEENLREIDDSLCGLAHRSLEAPSSRLPEGFAKRIARAAQAASAAATPKARVIDAAFTRRSLHLVAAAAALVVMATVALLAAKPARVVGMVAYEEGNGTSKGRQVMRGDRFEAQAPLTAWLDSSRVHLMLNTGANLEIRGREDVTLHSGEAWFHVTPNSGRFAVSTPRGTVSVVGTAFGVAVSADGVTVSVTRGKVRTEFDGRERFVAAGETLASAADARNRRGSASLAEPPAWATELLEKESQERLQLFFPSAAPVGQDETE